MTRRIYAYSDLREICNAPFYDEVRNLPMITTSSEMSRLIGSHPDLGLAVRPCSFSSFLSVVSSGWNNEADRVNRMVLASEYFRIRMAETLDDCEYEWLRNWRKNKDMLLADIVLFVEAGLEPEDFPKGHRDLKLMLDLWRFIRENSQSIKRLNEGLESLSDPSVADSIMMKMFGCVSKVIVLQGFFFITPVQERLFMLLERCGYDLIMLIHYDPRYPYANQIWETTYSRDNGYPPISEWTIQEGKKVNVLGEILEGRSSEGDSHTELRGQDSIVDLIRDVNRSRDDGYAILSPDSKGANEVLRNFFPEGYENRTLMSYPLGQFLYIIYNMWDDDLGTIVVDVDGVRGCLSTGWLSYGRYDSRDYVSVMDRASSFFQDCSTKDEWDSRFGVLEHVYSDILPVFGRPDGTDDRWSKSMSNPLGNIAPFTLDRADIDAIVVLVGRLFDVADDLFSGEDTTIKQHLEKIRTIIRRCSEASPILMDESGIMDSVINRASPSDKRLHSPCDMRDAMLSFFNEGTDEYEENGSKLRGLVKPLRQMEECCLDMSQGIHIILSDIKRLPGGARQFIWPVTPSLIGSLLDTCTSDQQRLLTCMVNVMETTPISNRYLTYSAFFNDKVVLSWVRNMNSKKNQPSPFIKMLSDLGGILIHDFKRMSSVQETIWSLEGIHMGGWSFDIKALDYTSNEAKMDYSICPLRYLYGFVLADHPSYGSSFHIQFVVSNLITAIRGLCPNIDPQTIVDEVMSLFPNLKDIEKKQIEDFTYSGTGGRSTDYRGYRYTDERYRLGFPSRELLDMARIEFGKLYSPNGRVGLELGAPSELKGACVFCQHGTYCRQVIHGIDQEEYYGR